MNRPVAFNKPPVMGGELDLIRQAIKNGKLSGNGEFTKRCQAFLAQDLGAARVLLTHSCTAALEMAAMLIDIGPGDEVIMPSYTFVSTANAVVLRGGVPVFIDVTHDTINIDASKIEAAITPRTKAISVVHYAGVGCEMDRICDIATRRGLVVMEDAAQAHFATYNGKPLGSFGALAALSFHDTKNVISGEGGALIVNDPALAERAEIIWEKGTDRSKFLRGEVDKYTWVDIGSSYLPSELNAAFLLPQLEAGLGTCKRRLGIWRRYQDAFAPLEASGRVQRPRPPNAAEHNGHIYFLLLPDEAARERLRLSLKEAGAQAVTHYVPLHSSPAGLRYGRAHGDLSVTSDVAARLLRLPMFVDLSAADQDRVIELVHAAVR